jgi:leucyl aminopeptidase (aminopeptidase T)
MRTADIPRSTQPDAIASVPAIHATSDMLLTFERGLVVPVEGRGELGDKFDGLHRSRRNLAKLGIGSSQNANQADEALESEKIRGMVRLGIGDSSHIDGTEVADLHEDFVIPEPQLFLDHRVGIGGTQCGDQEST